MTLNIINTIRKWSDKIETDYSKEIQQIAGYEKGQEEKSLEERITKPTEKKEKKKERQQKKEEGNKERKGRKKETGKEGEGFNFRIQCTRFTGIIRSL